VSGVKKETRHLLCQPVWLLVKLTWCSLVSSDGVTYWDCISRAWFILTHEIKLPDVETFVQSD